MGGNQKVGGIFVIGRMSIIETQLAVTVFDICNRPFAIDSLNGVKSYKGVDMVREPVNGITIIPLSGCVCGLAAVHKLGDMAFISCRTDVAIDRKRLGGEIGGS